MNNVTLIGTLVDLNQVNEYTVFATLKIDTTLIPLILHQYLSAYALQECYTNMPIGVQGYLQTWNGSCVVKVIRLFKMEVKENTE